MPANEFEKQVQRQLDDFDLNPSASVWKKVEQQIRKKRRRRVVVFFLLSAALIMGGYYTYLLSHSGSKTDALQPTTSIETYAPTPGNNNTTAGKDKKVLTSKSQQPTVTNALRKENSERDRQRSHTSENELQVSSGNTSPLNKIHSQSSDDMEVTIDTPNSSIVDLSNNKQINVRVEDQDKDPIKRDTSVTTAKQSFVIATDSIHKNEAEKGNQQIRIAKKKYRIKWGVDASIGFTSNQGKVFSLDKTADRAYVANSPSVSMGGGTPLIVDQPSSIQPGAAYRIGATGELQVSKRSRLSAGLQYFYASNRIKKGTLVYTLLPVQQVSGFSSTPVDHVYHGSPQSDYVNSYHFLSMPLGYHWQINKSKKLPVQWDLGISFDYLLSSNALIYNSSYGGIYYHDGNVINKMHISIGTGLSLRVPGKRGPEWVVGPEIYFDTRRLLSNSIDSRQYLFFAGINAKFFFLQKKNK